MLHPHRLRVAFEDLKAAIVAATAHALRPQKDCVGRRKDLPIGAKHVSMSQASSRPGFQRSRSNSLVSRILDLCPRGRNLVITDTTTGSGCCAETFQSTAGQLCNGKSVAGVGGTLSRGAAVKLRLYNRPRSQPVRSTHLGVRKYRQLVVTSRAHV